VGLCNCFGPFAKKGKEPGVIYATRACSICLMDACHCGGNFGRDFAKESWQLMSPLCLGGISQNLISENCSLAE